MNDNIVVQFENAVRKALDDFKQRVEQQRLFKMQNNLLKRLHEEVKIIGYCDSEMIEDLSFEYDLNYNKLRESGRTYEHIIQEKSLVDTYSAFEKFLFDCFCSIYDIFPKYLGNQITVNTADLFISENIELCKKNIIESKVKNLIQSNNIMEILNGFKKDFSIKNIESCVSDEEKNILYEISLVRNIVIHNNSMVNRIYMEQIRKFFKGGPRYPFDEEDTVLEKLEDLVQDLKDISTRVCEKIANALINDSRRLKEYHENKT